MKQSKSTYPKLVEEAVSREMLRQTVSDIRTRNADMDEGGLAQLLDEELGVTRMTFWTDARR